MFKKVIFLVLLVCTFGIMTSIYASDALDFSKKIAIEDLGKRLRIDPAIIKVIDAYFDRETSEYIIVLARPYPITIANDTEIANSAQNPAPVGIFKYSVKSPFKDIGFTGLSAVTKVTYEDGSYDMYDYPSIPTVETLNMVFYPAKITQYTADSVVKAIIYNREDGRVERIEQCLIENIKDIFYTQYYFYNDETGALESSVRVYYSIGIDTPVNRTVEFYYSGKPGQERLQKAVILPAGVEADNEEVLAKREVIYDGKLDLAKTLIYTSKVDGKRTVATFEYKFDGDTIVETRIKFDNGSVYIMQGHQDAVDLAIHILPYGNMNPDQFYNFALANADKTLIAKGLPNCASSLVLKDLYYKGKDQVVVHLAEGPEYILHVWPPMPNHSYDFIYTLENKNGVLKYKTILFIDTYTTWKGWPIGIIEDPTRIIEPIDGGISPKPLPYPKPWPGPVTTVTMEMGYFQYNTEGQLSRTVFKLVENVDGKLIVTKRITRIFNYDASGNVSSYLEYAYDDVGNLAEIKSYNADFKLTKINYYEIGPDNKPRITAVEYYDATTGNLAKYVDYEYNELDPTKPYRFIAASKIYDTSVSYKLIEEKEKKCYAFKPLYPGQAIEYKVVLTKYNKYNANEIKIYSYEASYYDDASIMFQTVTNYYDSGIEKQKKVSEYEQCAEGSRIWHYQATSYDEAGNVTLTVERWYGYDYTTGKLIEMKEHRNGVLHHVVWYQEINGETVEDYIDYYRAGTEIISRKRDFSYEDDQDPVQKRYIDIYYDKAGEKINYTIADDGKCTVYTPYVLYKFPVGVNPDDYNLAVRTYDHKNPKIMDPFLYQYKYVFGTIQKDIPDDGHGMGLIPKDGIIMPPFPPILVLKETIIQDANGYEIGRVAGQLDVNAFVLYGIIRPLISMYEPKDKEFINTLQEQPQANTSLDDEIDFKYNELSQKKTVQEQVNAQTKDPVYGIKEAEEKELVNNMQQ